MTALNSHVKHAITYLFVSVVFNSITYTKHSISPFFSFIANLVKDETFELNIDENKFEVQIYSSGHGFWAIILDKYEPGSVYGNHSLKSREDALAGLIEQITEKILSEK